MWGGRETDRVNSKKRHVRERKNYDFFLRGHRRGKNSQGGGGGGNVGGKPLNCSKFLPIKKKHDDQKGGKGQENPFERASNHHL